jgi:hypothetical protein
LVKQHRIDPECGSSAAVSADNLAHPDNLAASEPICTGVDEKGEDYAADQVGLSPTGPAVINVTSRPQSDKAEEGSNSPPPPPQPIIDL